MSEAILQIKSNVVPMPLRAVRAPLRHPPPPVPAAVRRDLFGGFASLLLLVPSEAGAGKVAELDGELLACCSDAEAASGQAAFVMDGLELLEADDPAATRSLETSCPLVFAYSDAVYRAARLPGPHAGRAACESRAVAAAPERRSEPRRAGGLAGARRGREGVKMAPTLAARCWAVLPPCCPPLPPPACRSWKAPTRR